MRSTCFQAVFIFVLGAIFFTLGLAHQEIIGFESRFYLFALEMWRHGFTWFPTTYGQPYPDYPVTGIALIYGIAKITGDLNKWTAVFPTALAAAMTLTVTYCIGRLHAMRWGIAAVVFLLLTYTFVVEARTISFDQYTTLFTALCFYLVYSATLQQKPQRVHWIFPLLVLSFACRGPIGLIIPTGVVCMYYLISADLKRFFYVGSVAAILLVMCSAVLLGLAYWVGGVSFLQSVWQMEVVGRIAQDLQTPPVYFYFTECMGAYALSYPLALLVLLGVSSIDDKEKRVFLWVLLGWVLIILVGLSVPADKKTRYILPIAPALALICGYLYTVLHEQRYFYRIRCVWDGCCSVFPLLALVIVFFLHRYQPSLVFSYHAILAILVILQVMMFFLWRREMSAMMLAALTFIAINIFVIEPINIDLNRTHDFVVHVENLRKAQKAQLVFYQEGKDGLAIKYLVNTPEETQPLFITEPDALWKITEPVVIVSTEEHFQQLSHPSLFHIMLRGKIGREPMIVFHK